MKTNFNEGFENSGFSATENYLNTKMLTQASAVLIAGALMSGCQMTPKQMHESFDEYQSNRNAEIQRVTKDTLHELAEGKSGVYKAGSNEVIFISNYDDSQPMSKTDEKALAELVSPKILEATHSFYKQGGSHFQKAHGLQESPVHYINIENNAFTKAIDYIAKNEQLELLQKYGNKMVVMHELGHFYTNSFLSSGRKGYKEEQLNEISADYIGTTLLSIAYDIPYEEYDELIDQLQIVRSRFANHTGELDHYTNQGLETMQVIYQNNPEIYEQVKDMDINQIIDITVKMAQTVSYDSDQKAETNIYKEAREKIAGDYQEYAKSGELADNSYLSNYYATNGRGLKEQLRQFNLAKENQEQHPSYSEDIMDQMASKITKLNYSEHLTKNVSIDDEPVQMILEHIESVAKDRENMTYVTEYDRSNHSYNY